MTGYAFAKVYGRDKQTIFATLKKKANRDLAGVSLVSII